ncbi:unnamed protein product [Soboliphyme baturini]|uniref:DET1- and DDB1-associated protein 1 n=1 Tax=Soboliphyme baturini TaxID=241478 RepID=A0A183IJW7_9BILA|nr:unnamed protein product [Soboliphyme baturini]
MCGRKFLNTTAWSMATDSYYYSTRFVRTRESRRPVERVSETNPRTSVAAFFPPGWFRGDGGGARNVTVLTYRTPADGRRTPRVVREQCINQYVILLCQKYERERRAQGAVAGGKFLPGAGVSDRTSSIRSLFGVRVYWILLVLRLGAMFHFYYDDDGAVEIGCEAGKL